MSTQQQLICDGCGRADPMGRHYSTCTLLEPGDVIVSRYTERELFEVNQQGHWVPIREQ